MFKMKSFKEEGRLAKLLDYQMEYKAEKKRIDYELNREMEKDLMLSRLR